MDGDYTELIAATSRLLAEGLLRDADALVRAGHELDAELHEVVREIGRLAMEVVLKGLSAHLEKGLKTSGVWVERRPKVRFKTVFGEVVVKSPYLRNRRTGERARPLLEVFGVEGGRHSARVERALVDFGVEKSFSRAASSFEEHYGFEVGRTTILKRTHDVARAGERYLAERWAEAAASFELPRIERVGVLALLLQLDGCEIRTGRYMTAGEAGRSDREPDKLVRVEHWREVRTGLALPLVEVDPTYVCGLLSYPDICRQLFAAACLRGLTEDTDVVAVGDGGIGLREELAVHFPGLQYILDWPHLKSHFYETAAALEVDDALQARWVDVHLTRIWDGQIDRVRADLTELHAETACERLGQLLKHLERFADAVDYGSFEERGWPIGSGRVESAHRFIPQERLKIPGACWHPESVNPLLALRVLRANGWWSDFWEWRLENRKKAAA